MAVGKKASAPALASSTSSQDAMILELFNKVQEKKLLIEKAEKPNWQTSGNFRYSQDSAHNSINIQILTDVRKLVEIYAFILSRSNDHNQANEDLGTEVKFTWLSFSADEWKSDITTRINQLSIQNKRKELAEYEARLNTLISPEMKRQFELEAIKKALEA